MNKPGIAERWQLSQPGVIAAVVAGIVLGGWAGATFKGSGMFFSNLILGGVLLVLLVLVGIGAVAAALAHRTGTARILAGFIGVTVVATGVAYSLAPPYRSPDAGIDHRGTATVRVAELTPTEWSLGVSCRTREVESPVFRVWGSGGSGGSGDRWIDATLYLGPGTTPSPNGLWISLVAMPAGPVQYTAPPGSDLDVTLGDADGLTGSARFSAAKVTDAALAPNPEPARLTGIIEWACA